MASRLLLLLPLLLAAPLSAKESLGIFGAWGAFRDTDVPRCYAIAASGADDAQRQAFASVGTWPRRDVRNQVHFRLSRNVAPESAITLRIGDRRFDLTGGGGDAWARNRQMDAAIVSAMRGGAQMRVSARAENGRRFTDSYSLSGVATAMDAATVGCTQLP